MLSISLAAATFISKIVCHHFWPGPMAWQHPKKENSPPHLRQKE
jgi:hypothetical protein